MARKEKSFRKGRDGLRGSAAPPTDVLHRNAARFVRSKSTFEFSLQIVLGGVWKVGVCVVPTTLTAGRGADRPT